MPTIFHLHINGLRALAVTGVILYHLKVPGFASGFVGVDVFFVISGYLMTNILLSEQHQSLNFWPGLRSFYANRARRIVPALAVLCTLTLIAFATILLPSEYLKLLRSSMLAQIFLSNFFFKNQSNYFDTSAENNPLLHTWSLSAEWQFYLLYPIALYLIRKKSLLFKSVAVTFITTATFSYSLYIVTYAPADAYFMTGPRTWEFLIGAMVSLWHINLRTNQRQSAGKMLARASLLALAALLFSFYCLDASKFPGWQAILPVISTSFLIANRDAGFVNRILATKPFQVIGNISYSLYLWHWPVYVYLLRSVAVDRPLTPLEQCLTISLSVFFSALSYQWVETPFRNRTDFWNDKRNWQFWAASSLVAISLLGIGLRTKGMDFRLPDYMLKAEAARLDSNPKRKECFMERADKRVSEPASYCSIGLEIPTQKIALWGDSFADAIQPMVEETLYETKKSGIVVAISGCAPIDEFPYVDARQRANFQACATDYNRHAFQYLLTSDEIKIVVFSAFWQMYDKEIMRRRFPSLVCELKKQGKVPIIFGIVPTPQFDVPRIWGNRQRKESAEISEITFSRERFDQERLDFRALLDTIRDTCGEINFIEPADALCSDKSCYAVRDGEAQYYDEWHLSRNGAKRLHKIFKASINKATGNGAERL